MSQHAEPAIRPRRIIMSGILAGVGLGIMGCAALPPRSGCVAGEGGYAPFTRASRVHGVTANLWCGKATPCPAFRGIVEFDPEGRVLKATCEPMHGPD